MSNIATKRCVWQCGGCLHINENDTCNVVFQPERAWKSPLGCKAKRVSRRQIEADENARVEYLKSMGTRLEGCVIVAGRGAI